MPKVALVHDFFTQWGGGERVLKIFTEIYPEAPIYLIAYDPKLTAEFLPGKTINPSFLQKYPKMPEKFKYYLPLMPKAIESFDLSEFDIILSDSSAFAKGVKTKPHQIHVCYLHTPTRYLTSDRHTYAHNAPVPALAKPLLPLVLNRLARWDLEASKRPDVIIANSEYIAERTRTYYHREPDYVLFPPVEIEKYAIAQSVGDYYLVVARQEPYKRTDLAIKAANELKLKLKVVGSGTRSNELLDLAGPTVEFVGRVSDAHLAELYSQAIAFIFPPKEDAGMTPLEAMASGRPVIAYGEGGALESVVAGKTGEFFKEQTVESLVQVLREFRPENYSSTTIRDHARRFDTSLFKKKIAQYVESAWQANQATN